jgi:hypothetical protein
MADPQRPYIHHLDDARRLCRVSLTRLDQSRAKMSGQTAALG